jgi:hypothetical protein
MGIEISEYQELLKKNGVEIPENLKASAEQKAMERTEKISSSLAGAAVGSSFSGAARKQSNTDGMLSTGGGASAQELRDLKIKLARKEKELRDVQLTLEDLKSRNMSSNQDYSQL